MGRKAFHTHIFSHTERVDYGTAGTVYQPRTFCGEGYAEEGRDQRLGTCPLCARKWAKPILAALAGRVTTESIDPGNYKTLFRVSVDGVVRGFVSIEKGFGRSWQIRPLRPRNYERDTEIGKQMGVADPLAIKWKTKDGTPIFPVHHAARDAAFSIFPELVELGLLPTVEEQMAKRDAEKVKEQQRAEERRQEIEQASREATERRIARETQSKHAREAIQSIIGKCGGVGGHLSNFDAEGLKIALTLLS